MKNIICVLFASGLLLLTAGCTKEYNDRALAQRIQALEEDMKALKTQVSSMNSQIDGVSATIAEWKKGGFIERIQEIQGGYTITFLGGKTVTLYHGKDGANGTNGSDGHTPVITIGANGNWFIDGKDTGKPSRGAAGDPGTPGEPGDPGHDPVITIGPNGNWFIDGEDTGFSAQGKDGKDGDDGQNGENGENGADGISPTIVNKDGELYWALDGELILVDGQPVPATVIPVFTIDENGHLIMTIGGKEVDLGIVRGASGDSMLKDIQAGEESVVFTLSDNSTIEIPFAKAFKLVIDKTDIGAIEGETLTIKYEVKNADASTTVDAFAGGDYLVAVDAEKSELKVMVPDPFKRGQVLVWAQNDKGLFSMLKLSFDLRAEVTVITEELDAVVGDAGLLDVQITSNMPFEVVMPEDADWIKLKEVKAKTYVLTFELTDNDTEAPRTAEVKILRADTKELVQTIAICQLVRIIKGRVEIDFNDVGLTAMEQVESVEVEGVTVSFDIGTGTEYPIYMTAYESIRLNPGNTMTVSAANPIKEIDFTMSLGFDGTEPIVPNTGNMDQETRIWTKTVTTKKVTFTVSDTRRVVKLVVFQEVE